MAPPVAVSKPSPPAATGAVMKRMQERAHPVVAEALPHLGEEQRRQPARVPEKRPVVRGCRGISHGVTAYTTEFGDPLQRSAHGGEAEVGGGSQPLCPAEAGSHEDSWRPWTG